MTTKPANTELHLAQHKDDPEHAALLTRFWAVTITCAWCGEPFHPTMAVGPKQKYCPEHRTESRRAHFKDGAHHEQ